MSNYENPTYVPASWSQAQIKEIYDNRKLGIYCIEDTADEVLTVVDQLRSNRHDVVSTLIKRAAVFNTYNVYEFMRQVDAWRSANVVLRPCNIFESQCGAYGKAIFFTIQPAHMDDDNDPGICTVAMAFGRLVHGYTYITIDPRIPQMVMKMLRSKA